MTPEEFTAKWEGTTSGGWTICGSFEKDSNGWNVLLRKGPSHVGMGCYSDDGRVILSQFAYEVGNLVPRKVERWVPRDEMKVGMRFERTDGGSVGGRIEMVPCVVWGTSQRAYELTSYSSDTKFLVKENA